MGKQNGGVQRAVWQALVAMAALCSCPEAPPAHVEQPQDVDPPPATQDPPKITQPETGRWLRVTTPEHLDVLQALPFDWPSVELLNEPQWSAIESQRGSAYYATLSVEHTTQDWQLLQAAITKAGFQLDGALYDEYAGTQVEDFFRQEWRVSLSSYSMLTDSKLALAIVPETTDQRAVPGAKHWDRPGRLPPELCDAMVAYPGATLLSVQVNSDQSAGVLMETTDQAADVLAYYTARCQQADWRSQQSADGWHESFGLWARQGATILVVCNKEDPALINMAFTPAVIGDS